MARRRKKPCLFAQFISNHPIFSQDHPEGEKEVEKPEAGLKLPEKLNIPCFVFDYFRRGTWEGEALQALNDHIGMLEKAHNELLDYLAKKEL